MKSQINNIKNKFKIIITVGDESGIGPEIILKALFSKEIPNSVDISIVGSKINLDNTYKDLKSLGITNIVDPSDYKIHDIKVPFEINQQRRNGNASFIYLKRLLKLSKNIQMQDS